MGSKNPAWKGDKAGYGAIHDYVRSRKPKPNLCERCDIRPAMDLANVSQQYKRDLGDWEYLCRKCHMDSDGRNDRLRDSGKSRRLPNKTCVICNKIFHTDAGRQQVCGMSCRGALIWKKRRGEI